jgi:hypothetical protein
MAFRAAALATLTLLVASAVSAQSRGGSAAGDYGASDWMIGPILDGRNYSRGVPLHPTPIRNGGWFIDLPQAPGNVNYVTFRHGSLAGKTRIVMRYRVEAAPGVRIIPRNYPQWTGSITPYLQRAGDNWSARGRFEAYRWYGTFATRPLMPGEHQIVAPLNANWTAIEKSSARTNPRAFQDAVLDADQVGFVLGGGDGYGHGVSATGPARLVVLDFRIE